MTSENDTCDVCGNEYDRTEERGFAVSEPGVTACVGEDAVFVHDETEAADRLADVSDDDLTTVTL